MPKTRVDVGQQALRRIGVCAVGDNPTAEDQAQAVITMDAALAEFVKEQGVTITWDADTVPDATFLAFSDLVASELALIYRLNGPSRANAIGRMRADLLPDDREDRRDLDEDGTVTEAEIEADKRAQYF